MIICGLIYLIASLAFLGAVLVASCISLWNLHSGIRKILPIKHTTAFVALYCFVFGFLYKLDISIVFKVIADKAYQGGLGPIIELVGSGFISFVLAFLLSVTWIADYKIKSKLAGPSSTALSYGLLASIFCFCAVFLHYE